MVKGIFYFKNKHTGKGRALFVTKDIEEGDTIWEEDPLVSISPEKSVNIYSKSSKPFSFVDINVIIAAKWKKT